MRFLELTRCDLHSYCFCHCRVAVGFACLFLLASPSLGSDLDGDGILDVNDNCILVQNLPQRDTDGDGCGNQCDGDFDQDGTVGMDDLAEYRAHLFQVGADLVWDLDGNGDVGNGPGFLLFRDAFRDVIPGPSGVSTDPVACP